MAGEMYRFVIQAWPEWDSKLNMLSMAVAGTAGGTYWFPGASGRAVVQAADGICEVPPGCVPYAAIVHDGMEYRVSPRPILRIGLGEVPGCTANLSSYPLREKDMHRLPESAAFDAVVGGRCPDAGSCEEAVVRAGLSGMRVAVATTGSPGISGRISGMLRDAGNEVAVVEAPQLPTVSALYRTCRTVVHLGDCRRGYLHSLAMYHAGVPGRTLVERVAGLDRFVPAGMAELIQFLGG
jgi:hypothetical protein